MIKRAWRILSSLARRQKINLYTGFGDEQGLFVLSGGYGDRAAYDANYEGIRDAVYALGSYIPPLAEMR